MGLKKIDCFPLDEGVVLRGNLFHPMMFCTKAGRIQSGGSEEEMLKIESKLRSESFIGAYTER